MSHHNNDTFYLFAHFSERSIVRAFLVVQKTEHLSDPLALELIENVV